jgi:hypothetical protein
MATQARVTSIDTLESFRASLILFLSKAHGSLDEVGDEVRRTRNWIQSDRRLHWEGEVRRRKRVLDQAEQELFSARMSVLRKTTTQQQAAVNRAKRALDEAEEKLRNVKTWNRAFDSSADPLVKGMEGFRHFLDQSMPKAISHLVRAQKTLESYAETPAPAAAPSPTAEPGNGK